MVQIGILLKTLIAVGVVLGTSAVVYVLVLHLLAVQVNVSPPPSGIDPPPAQQVTVTPTAPASPTPDATETSTPSSDYRLTPGSGS